MHQGTIEKTDRKVPGSNSATTVQPSGPAESAKKKDKTITSDTVVLTNRSQLLERLEKTVAELPAIDRARVEAVKADIASGNYQIDENNIASILLATEPKIGS